MKPPNQQVNSKCTIRKKRDAKNINDNNLLFALVFPNIFLVSEDWENLFLNKSFQTF